METCWRKFNTEDFAFGTGVFVPMLDTDRQELACDLAEDYAEGGTTSDPIDDERLQATHFFISITVPELEGGDTEEDRANYTWWDFGAMPAKMDSEGEWMVWYDDVYSAGNIWFQSTYTEVQVRAVYELAIQLASEGRLYNDLYDVCKSSIMKFW